MRGKFRLRSTFCPDRWAENLFEKSILVPLLLRISIFNHRLLFRAFYGLSSPSHSFHELQADLISLFPVSISLLVRLKLGLSHSFCCCPEKKLSELHLVGLEAMFWWMPSRNRKTHTQYWPRSRQCQVPYSEFSMVNASWANKSERVVLHLSWCSLLMVPLGFFCCPHLFVVLLSLTRACKNPTLPFF